MLAVVKEHRGPGFAIKEVPMPVCGEEDVIVKVKSVGFCGTDGPILAGTREVPWPLIPGHEFSGDIVEVGTKVKGWQIGDRVSACIVLGADCDKERLDMALKLGADYVINNSVEDPIERIKEITNGEMLDYVHDCAGAVPLVDTAMKDMEAAFEMFQSRQAIKIMIHPEG